MHVLYRLVSYNCHLVAFQLLTMCLLLGRVDTARLYAAGDVRAMSLWHWNDNIVLLGASIVDIFRSLNTGIVCDLFNRAGSVLNHS
jgi:hypothetical protein